MTTPVRPSTPASLPPHLVLLLAGVLATALLAWSGTRSAKLSAARARDLTRAQSTLASFADLRRRYEPAVAAESIAWRRAWLQLQELGVASGERLNLTTQVTRAAEDAGLRDVRVLIAAPDTTGQQPRLSTEEAQSTPAPYSLRVECRGGLESVLAFLDHLPPSVAATRLSLVRQDGQAAHRISLAVYEFTFTNGVPSGWSSIERGSVGSGGSRRPGG